MKKSAFPILAVLLLSGCSQQYPATDKALAQSHAKMDDLAKYAAPKPAERARVVHRPVATFGTSDYVIHEFSLPRELAGKPLVIKDTMTLRQIATYLSTHGIPTHLGDTLESLDGPAALTATSQAPSQGRPLQIPFTSGPAQPQTATLNADDASLLEALGVNNPTILGGAPLPPSYTIDFKGDANEFIHNVENYFGVEPSMQDGILHLDYYQTRVFHVNAPPSSDTQNTGFTGASALSSGGAAPNGGTGGSTNVTGSTTVDIWPEIDAQLKNMLPAKSHYVVSRGLGTVLVTASPVFMRKVERYFDDLNADLDPRIAVDIALIKVNMTDAANFDFDLNVLWQQAYHGGQLLLGGMVPSVVGATGTAGVQIVSGNSQFNTSQALLRAVASTGRLMDYKTGSTVTQNNHPGSFKLMTNQDYIKSIQSNVLGGSTNVVSTTITPATLSYGYNITVWPKMVGHNRISVNLSSLDSNLTSLTTVTVGGNQLQQAITTDGQIANLITLGQDETLVVSGFEQDTVSKQNSGVGEDTNMALGGTRDVNHIKTRLILVVSPKVLRSPDAGPKAAP